MPSGTAQSDSRHHPGLLHKNHSRCLHYKYLCKRTEQVNPFRHYCQADSVFDRINLVVDHLAHILSNRLAWIVSFTYP